MKNITSGLKSELGAYKTREILENYICGRQFQNAVLEYKKRIWNYKDDRKMMGMETEIRHIKAI